MYQCDQYFSSYQHHPAPTPSYWHRGYDSSSTVHSSDAWDGTFSRSSPSSMQSTTTRQIIGVSCVVVSIGTTATRYGQRNIPMVARVTLTDYNGYTILDTYVRPTYHVTDYRSSHTGLNHTHLQTAPSFSQVQDAVARSIQGNIIVGHRIWDFLSAVGLTHPAIDTRDMALYRPLRKRLKSRFIVDLSTLVRWFLGKEVGGVYENPLETAASSMELYRSCQSRFEAVVNSGAWPCDLAPVSFSRYYS